MFRMPNTPSLTRTLAASAVLAIGLTLSGGAFAQNAVVAKVGELEITEQELLLAQSELAQEFAKVPEDKRRAAILAALIDIKLLANKAQAAGYQEDEKFKSQMAFVRARTLHNIYFQKNVVEAISDEEIKEDIERRIAMSAWIDALLADVEVTRNEDGIDPSFLSTLTVDDIK